MEDKFDERREIISQLELKLQALEDRHKKLLEALRTINPDDTYENYNEQIALEAIEADRLASEDWKEN